jgi:acyl-CoA dehydrogenase
MGGHVAIDFELGPELGDLRERTRAYIDECVIPRESEAGSGDLDPKLLAELRADARDRGVFAPTAPLEFGGLGLDHRSIAVALEESGRSLLGPLALNCSAPDEGNILLLDKVATPAQRERYLAPLARGEVRSAFAMTEPSPGAGADPDRLQTVAVRDGDGWRIDGRKWLITGFEGSAYAIVMARTGDGAATMFLVDADNPGMVNVRRISTIEQGFAGGHSEIVFDNCRVRDDAILGQADAGFANAQVRLGPARLTHCMRWLGAGRRAHEIAVRYAADRPMFGTTLAELGMAQQMIADNEIDIAASRALIWLAAWKLDQGEAARQETSQAKVFVAEATFRIADRSVQLCGGLGVADDEMLGRILREVRPFRIYDGPSEVHRWSLAKRAVRAVRQGRLPGDYR